MSDEANVSVTLTGIINHVEVVLQVWEILQRDNNRDYSEHVETLHYVFDCLWEIAENGPETELIQVVITALSDFSRETFLTNARYVLGQVNGNE